MKKHNVQTIKHVIGVLAAEGGGNEVIEHCISELAAMIDKDQLKGYVKLLARQTAQELRPKVEAVSNATRRVPRVREADPAPQTPEEIVVDGPAPTGGRDALAEELRPFLTGRMENDEREIISAIFDKFDCRNVELAKLLGVRPNLIAKVKRGTHSPTLAAALAKFAEAGK